MTISLVEAAGANFRTDEQSDRLNDDFMKRLGMRKRYLPARLAIARSLAVSAPPESNSDEYEPGKVIKGDTLFGTGTTLSVWLALIAERAGEPDLEIRRLVALVGAHWRRGLVHLDKEWDQSGHDLPRFIRRLVEVADLPTGGRSLGRAIPNLASIATYSAGRIDIPVGEVAEDVLSREKVVWTLNGQGGSPHSALMGGVGSGKTRTAVSMLRSIRAVSSVPLLAFDFKGDLGTDPSGGGYHLDELFDATILEPPRSPIPLDVLALKSNGEIDVAEAASRFRESFSRLKGSRLGDRQRSAVHEAATHALSAHRPCELRHIREALTAVYEDHEMKDDGATATLQEICRFPLFQPSFSPAEFFSKSWIIRLPPNVSEDSRTIVVNLVLDALDQHLNSLPDAESNADGARGLRILCMVDEAHQILGSNLPSLSNLIRMSRSKGGAVMLISQSPDDFSGEDDEFLSEMGLVAAFSTNAPPRNAARILGKGANLAALKTGECFVKRRGNPNATRVKAW